MLDRATNSLALRKEQGSHKRIEQGLRESVREIPTRKKDCSI
jgi:hypothetical protein